MRRTFGAIWICCVTLLAAPAAVAGPAQDMIAELAASAEVVLNDRSLARDVRADRLRETLGKVVDKQGMARSLLGRYWRRADAGQQRTLVDLLETYLVDVYAGRVDAIDGQIDFAISGERALGERTMVDTQVLRPNGPPVDVTWQVETTGGRSVVTDIVVEGVSLIVSQRAEFASVIRQQGGIDGLIGLLEKKVETTR